MRRFIAYGHNENCASYAASVGGQIIQWFDGADAGDLETALELCERECLSLFIGECDPAIRRGMLLCQLKREMERSGMRCAGMLIKIMAAIGLYDKETSAASIKAGIARKKASGGHCGRKKGAYIRKAQLASIRSKKRAAAAYARKFFPLMAELRTQGFTLARIAQRLNENGYVTRKGKNWTASAVKRVMDLCR